MLNVFFYCYVDDFLNKCLAYLLISLSDGVMIERTNMTRVMKNHVEAFDLGRLYDNK